MEDITIRGKRFICPLRCSEDEQIASSIGQQEIACKAYLDREQAHVYEYVRLEAMSATKGEQIEPLLAIIKRKIDGEDFDGLAFDSFSRFVRSDVDACRLYAEACDANLLIVTAKEGLMMGPGSWAKRGSASDQSQGYTKDVSRNVNRGVKALIDAGLIPPTNAFIFGIDRMYFDAEGNKLFRVRRLKDGSKVVMDPDAPFKERYRIPASTRRLHLRPKDGRYEYCPGASEDVQTFKEMLRNHYGFGWGCYRIAFDLNQRGITNCNGEPWNTSSVRVLLRNPIYFGLCVGSRTAGGKWTERRSGLPLVFPLEQRPGYCQKDTTRRRKRIPLRDRDPKDYFERIQPLLSDLHIDQPEIESAMRNAWAELKKRGGPKVMSEEDANNWARRRGESYFLSHILRIKSDGYPMVGTKTKRKHHTPQRYYVTRRDYTKPCAQHMVERVRVDICDAEVMTSLGLVLNDTFAVLEGKIASFVRQRQKAFEAREDNSKLLRDEKARHEKWYREVYSTASARGQSILVDESKRVDARLDEIDDLLSRQRKDEVVDLDVKRIKYSLKRQFSELDAKRLSDSKEELRRLAEIFVSSMTFDPSTNKVEIEYALPSWAIKSGDTLVKRDRKNSTVAITGSGCANSGDAIPLVKVECQRVFEQRRSCLKCSRTAARDDFKRKAA